MKFGCKSRAITLVHMWGKMTCNHPKLDHVNINAHTKGSLMVWALYAYFSDSQKAAF